MRFYNGDRDWSEKERVERIAKIHRFSGYAMLLIGTVTASTGILHYFDDILMGDRRNVLSMVNLIVFVVLVASFEAIYRCRNKYAKGHIRTSAMLESFTCEQIDAAVKTGRKLVIFDNLVLDLNGYERNHPGGKFNLIHNLGRDISKFFFGGYNLVNVKGKHPKHHSQAALDIVKTMIVGVIEGQKEVADHLFKIVKRRAVTDNTCTFTFKKIDGERVTNLRRWYNDPRMIGRHFLVYGDQNRRVKRQYTICSAMGSEIRQALLALAESVVRGGVPKFDEKLLEGPSQDQIDLTLKTYGVKRGLATRIHSAAGSHPHSSKKAISPLTSGEE